MNFKLLVITLALTSGFIGSVFAQVDTVYSPDPEERQALIDELAGQGVIIRTQEGSFMIELFPEDAPNHVQKFLENIESGYYVGTVFHRIIPGFMIQGGDPNTKNPDQSMWGQGGPDYHIDNEVNSLKHMRGIVSMARSQGLDSAGSQFFIVHKDSPHLDGQYTAFGKLVPLGNSHKTLDRIANLETDRNDAPIDPSQAIIIEAKVIDFSGFSTPNRNTSLIQSIDAEGGTIDVYKDQIHKTEFDLPYRWMIVEQARDKLSLTIEPNLMMEHNVAKQVEQSGFVPQVIVNAENKVAQLGGLGGGGYFSINGGDEPKILSNYVFENDAGRKAHMMITTQELQTENGPMQFKVLQIHFNTSDKTYSIIYVNVTEWFRYEVPAFTQVVDNFKVIINGEMQQIDFINNPIFKQLITDAKAAPEPESLPPARIGGCLICLLYTSDAADE